MDDDFPKYTDGPKPGAYVILNNMTGEFYVGSSKHIARRRQKHESDLRINKHPNKALQESYNSEIGQLCFIALQTCDRNSAYDEEQRILDINKTNPNCVNTTFDARVSFRGESHSDETKETLRQLATGRRHTPEQTEKNKTVCFRANHVCRV